VLTVEITDDGVGGADETRGTGITGIRRRAAALDGIAHISSPAGGPTVVRVEVPCGS
jgi:signal transduction histidine kinase